MRNVSSVDVYDTDFNTCFWSVGGVDGSSGPSDDELLQAIAAVDTAIANNRFRIYLYVLFIILFLLVYVFTRPFVYLHQYFGFCATLPLPSLITDIGSG